MENLNKYQIASLLVAVLLFGIIGSTRAATQVGLGSDDNFAVLAGSTITNTGNSVINGDLGLSPGTAVTGFPPGTVNGTQHVTDATALQAQTDLTTAYTNAAGQTVTGTISADLGGQTLAPGVYHSASSIGLTGTVTLDGGGDADAVFIFQAGSTLTTASSSVVSLINGAQACNVFWQVGSSATLGTGSTFRGNILALTSITLTTAADVEGRVLARNGAVTLDTNTITKAVCLVPPPPVVVTPPPAVVTDSGPSLPPPLINVTKIPTPLNLPAGAGPVRYDYTVLNVGTVAMSNVTVTDNKCPTVAFVSGDTNNNSQLDLTETWLYRCTVTLSQTTTNTVTATGIGNALTATDTANATVVVGSALPPPLIHLVKKPNLFSLPVSGGAITYTYTITNPGTAPLSNVSVTDNKCTGLPGRVSGHPGDVNKNNLLESNETWTFTCLSNLTATTTNIGTAEGHANGLTALDFSPATVLVTATGLPNTGSNANNSVNRFIPLALAILALGLVAGLALYARNKRRLGSNGDDQAQG